MSTKLWQVVFIYVLKERGQKMSEKVIITSNKIGQIWQALIVRGAGFEVAQKSDKYIDGRYMEVVDIECQDGTVFVCSTDIACLYENEISWMTFDQVEKCISESISKYEEHIKENGVYDFQAGRKIKNILKRLNMEIITEKDLEDTELTSSGVMSNEVFEMWKNRLDRLDINKYYPEKISQEIKQELLTLFKNPEHQNNTKVKFIAAKKI